MERTSRTYTPTPRQQPNAAVKYCCTYKWVILEFICVLVIGMLSGFTIAYIMYRGGSNDDRDLAVPKSRNSNELYWEGEEAVADSLRKKVRVLCWVMTGPMNHKKKAVHVKATWAKRFDTVLYMSSEKDESLPTIALPVGEGRENLWGKTREAFKYIYEHGYTTNGTYDWVMKTDDDTFVIAENLRHLLSDYDPTKALYFGIRYKPWAKEGYMAGGPGYILSKEAVRRFVVDGIGGRKCRLDNGGAEDVEMGRCMTETGVEFVDTRDTLGRNKFLVWTPSYHLTKVKSWFWDTIYYPSEDGPNCCSDTAVSFHYVNPRDMYAFDYFLYHLRPYGINHSLPASLIRTD